jgi:hypothetical protein
LAVPVSDCARAIGILRSPTRFSILCAARISVSQLILKPRGPPELGRAEEIADEANRTPRPANGNGMVINKLRVFRRIPRDLCSYRRASFPAGAELMTGNEDRAF